MEIYVVFDQAGILSVIRTMLGGAISTEQMNANGGGTLDALGAYGFRVPVDQGESINLQYTVSANLTKLAIRELPYET